MLRKDLIIFKFNDTIKFTSRATCEVVQTIHNSVPGK
jgi:hypothetical protein